MAWILKPSQNGAIHNPTWSQIQDAILELNGHHLCELDITLEETGSLIIGGGNGKRYIVVFLPKDDLEEAYSMTLVDESLTGPDVTLTVQTSDEYPSRMAVQLPLVLQVVEQFHRTGKLLENVCWEP